MPEYLAPGVYVVEIEETAKPIGGIAVDVDEEVLWSIVRDVRKRLETVAPDWTDHNESDPGVTLLGLFAWMTELLIYRVKPRDRDRAMLHVSRLAAGALALISEHDRPAPYGVLKCVQFFRGAHRATTKLDEPLPHLVIGVVISADDPERKGRVLINCPSIAPETGWARIVRPLISGAGILLPEVGDKVLVGFENGDIQRPYVIGSL